MMKNNIPITISSVGDISLAGGFVERLGLIENWVDPEIIDFIKADVAIANMEYVILPEGETAPGGLCLAEPPASFAALKIAGFNVLTLGNNHILDFEREKGLQATIETIEKTGLKHCGAGLTLEEARKPAMVDVKGVKVAVFSRLNLGHFMDARPILAKEDSAGVVALEFDEIVEIIKKYRESGECDIAVLCIHWGMQNLHEHPPELHDLTEKLLANGVDLILGSHSHMLQGIGEFNGKYCFFGQGNFYFFPIPLPGYPGKLLYGPEETEHRLSAISKFTYDGDSWKAQVLPTRQEGDEIVRPVSEPESGKVKKLVFGAWSRRRQWHFHFNWRRVHLKARLKSLVYYASKLKIKETLWCLNPIRILSWIISPPTLG